MTDIQNIETRLPVDFIDEIKQIIESGRKAAYQAVGNIGLMTFWRIGKRIVEEEQGGNARATYGAKLIDGLSNILSMNTARHILRET